MKTFIIAKLDTPCTLNGQVQQVPTAEPVNFAKSLCEDSSELIRVILLGLEYDKIEVGMHTIEVVPYFGQPTKLKEYIDEDTKIIIWQGRHIVDVNLDRPSSELFSKPVLTRPRVSAYYEKLNFIKQWQVSMYNLLSSVVFKDLKMYALITDVRLPIIDLHKVDPTIVQSPLPKGITLLTQTNKASDYVAYHNQHGHGIPWLESDISKFIYQFQKAEYLPLHSLPIWSHVDAWERNEDRTVGKYEREENAVCQIQSLKYLDEYRIEQLQELVRSCDGNVTIMGRMGLDEQAVIRQKFPLYAEQMLKASEGSKDEPVPFHEAAEQLCRFKMSLVITDGRYSRFGLMPNRFVEAIATKTYPLIHEMVYRNTDELSKSIIKDIKETKQLHIDHIDYTGYVKLLKDQLISRYNEIGFVTSMLETPDFE